MSCLFRPACTQSSDEVFLTASNQIVNDPRSTPSRISIPNEIGRPRNLFSRARALYTTLANRKISLISTRTSVGCYRLTSIRLTKDLRLGNPVPHFLLSPPSKEFCDSDRRSRPQNY